LAPGPCNAAPRRGVEPVVCSPHRISRRGLLASLAGLLPPLRLAAQQGTTFSTDVNLVNLLATVRNHKGEIVRNLAKDDFSLDEDGRPQAIRYFSHETGLPLTLGLLVDTSMSQRRVLGEERTASYRFFDRVLREDKDLAFVIHFDREVELLQDVTSSRQKLESALGQLELPQAQRRPQPRGGGGGGGGGWGGQGRRRAAGTTLYDAVALASDELMKKQSGRKALIVLSDGVDTGSKLTLATAIESAQRADTLAYSILFADPQAYGSGMGGYGGYGGHGGGRRGGGQMPPGGQRPDGKKILQRLSRETGGAFFEVSKKLPIETVYDRIQDELRSQYSLGYVPDRPGAGPVYRKIHLATRDTTLVVQTRDGYYAKN
jgi:VWFA-related protein